MTNEERQELVYRLRQTAIVKDIVGGEAAAAADEIERLITEVRQLERDLQWTRERYAMAEYSKL